MIEVIAMEELLNSMGPIGFGLAMFLIIWFAVVAPQLNAQAQQSKAFVEMLSSLQSMVNSQSALAAQVLHDNQQFQAAQTKALDMIVKSMDTVVDRLADLKTKRSN